MRARRKIVLEQNTITGIAGEEDPRIRLMRFEEEEQQSSSQQQHSECESDDGSECSCYYQIFTNHSLPTAEQHQVPISFPVETVAPSSFVVLGF